nr:MAG TPA: hypothetical protein [Caudoviricetes sp.]
MRNHLFTMGLMEERGITVPSLFTKIMAMLIPTITNLSMVQTLCTTRLMITRLSGVGFI